jgi:hypothetical protein
MPGKNPNDDDDTQYQPFDPFQSPKPSPTPPPSDDEGSIMARALQALKDRYSKQ